MLAGPARLAAARRSAAQHDSARRSLAADSKPPKQGAREESRHGPVQAKQEKRKSALARPVGRRHGPWRCAKRRPAGRPDVTSLCHTALHAHQLDVRARAVQTARARMHSRLGHGLPLPAARRRARRSTAHALLRVASRCALPAIRTCELHAGGRRRRVGVLVRLASLAAPFKRDAMARCTSRSSVRQQCSSCSRTVQPVQPRCAGCGSPEASSASPGHWPSLDTPRLFRQGLAAWPRRVPVFSEPPAPRLISSYRPVFSSSSFSSSSSSSSSSSPPLRRLYHVL